MESWDSLQLLDTQLCRTQIIGGFKYTQANSAIARLLPNSFAFISPDHCSQRVRVSLQPNRAFHRMYALTHYR